VVVTVGEPSRPRTATLHTPESGAGPAGQGAVESPGGGAHPVQAPADAVLPGGVPSPEHDRVEPLAADLYRLHVTVSRRFLDKLEAARAIRSHARRRARGEAILEEALDLLLAREARRRTAATERPRAAPRPSSPDRITAEVRRQVWARDEGRCQWPLEGGGICGSTYLLELDHVRPKARGGPPTAANLRALCHAHNAEAARRAFGPEWMRRFGRDRPMPPTASARSPAG
jgi:5-methylcytosine-specific restriction endonuclease McrA